MKKVLSLLVIGVLASFALVGCSTPEDANKNADAPKTDAPKDAMKEAPKMDAPKGDAPKMDAPKGDGKAPGKK